MARRRESAPPPPGRGGYEFEVIELGPPIYYGTPPVPVAKGKLIPVGERTTTGTAPPPEQPTGSSD